MCLLSNRKTLKTAKEDIKCFKRFEFFQYGGDNIAFRTPYLFAPVPNDVMLGKQEYFAVGDLNIEENGTELYSPYKYRYRIYGGVIHCYLNQKDAIAQQCSDEIVVECIIPNGTEYIEGYDCYGVKSISAKKIKVVTAFKDETELKNKILEETKIFYML